MGHKHQIYLSLDLTRKTLYSMFLTLKSQLTKFGYRTDKLEIIRETKWIIIFNLDFIQNEIIFKKCL
jgi:hypothetical protein